MFTVIVSLFRLGLCKGWKTLKNNLSVIFRCKNYTVDYTQSAYTWWLHFNKLYLLKTKEHVQIFSFTDPDGAGEHNRYS